MNFHTLCREIARLIKKGNKQSLLRADQLIVQAAGTGVAENDIAAMAYVTHLRLRLLARQGKLEGLMATSI